MSDFTHEHLSFQEKIDLAFLSIQAVMESRIHATAEAAKLETDAMIVRYAAQGSRELESVVVHDFYDIYRFSAAGFEQYVEDAFASAADAIQRTRLYISDWMFDVAGNEYRYEIYYWPLVRRYELIRSYGSDRILGLGFYPDYDSAHEAHRDIGLADDEVIDFSLPRWWGALAVGVRGEPLTVRQAAERLKRTVALHKTMLNDFIATHSPIPVHAARQYARGFCQGLSARL